MARGTGESREVRVKLRNVKTGEVRKADLNRDERPVVKISGRKVTLRWAVARTGGRMQSKAQRIAEAWIAEIGEHEGADGAEKWAEVTPAYAATLYCGPETDEAVIAEAAGIVVEHFRALVARRA